MSPSKSDSALRYSPSQVSRRSVLRAGAAGAALAVPTFGLMPSVLGKGLSLQDDGVRLPEDSGIDYLVYPTTEGTVRFSNCWGGARLELVEQWIADFSEIYPGITIENGLAECSALPEQQVTAIAGGQPPNVMMIKSDRIPFFAEQNALVALDDLMARDGVMADWYYPSEIASRVWQGTTYGLPNVTAGALHMLFLNTGLLETMGVDPETQITTWQDLDALVEPAKAAGLFVMDPAKISTGMTSHLVFTYANGGRYWDDDLTTILWNDDAGVEAAEWMLQFVKAQAGSYENLASGAARNNVLQPEDWAPEQYVAMINGSWTFFQLEARAPHISYSTHLFPRNADNPESEGRTPTTGGWSFCMTQAGADQEAAWEWMKFTCASSAACDFLKAQGQASSLLACNEDPEMGAGNPYWSVVEQDLASNIAVPVTSIHPQFIQMWLDMEDAFLYEEMTPKEALDYYAEQGQALLDEWNASRG